MDFVKPLTKEELKTSLEFFNIMNFVLTYSPTVPSEKALRERFAKIGIEGGKTFDPSKLSPEIRTAIEAGRADAWEDFAGAVKQMDTGEITSGDVFGSREFLGDNYLYRWLGTTGIYGNAKEEAIYPVLAVNSKGEKLDGANKYTLRFAPASFAGERVLVHDDVQTAGEPARRQSARPLPVNSTMTDQFVGDADSGHPLLPEQVPGNGQGTKLAARARGPVLGHIAPILAEGVRAERRLEGACRRARDQLKRDPPRGMARRAGSVCPAVKPRRKYPLVHARFR